MSKVTGPLFSIDAEGKIAKNIVSTKWKGIKISKKYKVPKNPRTERQQTGRNYMKDAVIGWKTAGYIDLDIEAWNRYAKIQKKAKSGYNQYITCYINAMHEGLSWSHITECDIDDVGQDFLRVRVKVDYTKDTKMYIGTNIYNMDREVDGYDYPDPGGPYQEFNVSGLIAYQYYYFFFKNILAGEGARTGIYKVYTKYWWE